MDTLSTLFSALADPTRRAILARLAEGEATVKDLSSPFAISGPAISKHLRVLEKAGLITRGRDAQWRPCRLEAEPLREVTQWAEGYRRFWDATYDRLDEYLSRLQENPSRLQENPNRLEEETNHRPGTPPRPEPSTGGETP